MVHQKILIGIVAVIILIVGVFIGSFLALNLGGNDIDAIIIGLVLTNIIILLIISGLVLEMKEMLQSKLNKK